MGGGSARGRRRRYRRRLRTNSRAVVSVVGTLLALLVFFALFGIFLTQYVPLWMTENEQQLSVQTQASMAQLKSNVDLQVALGGPPVYSVPFTTVSQSVPILTQPTTAILTFSPTLAGGFTNVSMKPGPGGSTNIYWQNLSVGRFTVVLPDRYYSPQTFSFENDAIIQGQVTSQQVVDYPPLIAVYQSGQTYGVTLQVVQLVGASTQSVASGTQEVFSHTVFSQTLTAVNASATKLVNANYTVGTLYPCAWWSFLNQTLSTSNLTASHYALSPSSAPSCSGGSGSASPVRVWFKNLNSFTLVFSEIRIVVGIGVE